MADMLNAGLAWLDAQRKAHMAQSVTYQRGSESVDLSATIGNSPFAFTSEDGVETTLRIRDFLITAADLVLGGVVVEPQAGDRIFEVANGLLRTHEVLAPSAGEPAWRYSDPHRLALRIHTKQIAQEPAP